MFAYSLRAASLCAGVGLVVLVTPPGHHSALDDLEGLIDGHAARDLPIEAVPGGATRQESVRAGLAAVPPGARAVVVHDAARPFATPDLFGRVIDALGGQRGASGNDPSRLPTPDGVVPALPCHDTVKRVRDDVVIETVAREGLFLVQTPQAFRGEALRRSHEVAAEHGLEGTDDAMLLEAAGYRVTVIPGEPANVKITTREDLERAERLTASGGPAGVTVIGQHA